MAQKEKRDEIGFNDKYTYTAKGGIMQKVNAMKKYLYYVQIYFTGHFSSCPMAGYEVLDAAFELGPDQQPGAKQPAKKMSGQKRNGDHQNKLHQNPERKRCIAQSKQRFGKN